MNDYETNDLGLTAALSLFSPTKSIDTTNPKRVVFRFEDTKELQERVKAYYNKNLLVDALSFFSEIKIVKGRAFNV